MLLDDGHGTIFSFAEGDLTASIEELASQPPGVSNGGGKTVTTHRNAAFRTRAPNKLKDTPPIRFTAAYASGARAALAAQVGVNQLITCTLPDGGTDAIWGFIDEFVPNENVSDQQPTAQCAIVFTHRNASGVETGPVYTAPAPA